MRSFTDSFDSPPALAALLPFLRGRGLEVRLRPLAQALDVAAVLDDRHARGADREDQLRRRHAEHRREHHDRHRRRERTRGDLLGQERDDQEHRHDADEDAPVDEQADHRPDGDALAAVEIVKNGETVAHDAGNAPRRDPRVPQELHPQPHGDGRLEHIARQRREPGAQAENARHIGSPRVAAAVLAHILPPAELAQQDGGAQRAEQVSDNDHERIAQNNHNATSYRCVCMIIADYTPIFWRIQGISLSIFRLFKKRLQGSVSCGSSAKTMRSPLCG